MLLYQPHCSNVQSKYGHINNNVSKHHTTKCKFIFEIFYFFILLIYYTLPFESSGRDLLAEEFEQGRTAPDKEISGYCTYQQDIIFDN